MRQFAIVVLIAICFPVHRIWKILAMRCLIHRSGALDVSIWSFVRAAVINSIVIYSIIRMMTSWWTSIHWRMIRILNRNRGVCIAHNVAEVTVCIVTRPVDSLADDGTVVHRRIGVGLDVGGCLWVTYVWLASSNEAVGVWDVSGVIAVAWLIALLVIAHVIFLSTLRTDTPESSQPSWSFIMIIGMLVSWTSTRVSVVGNLIITSLVSIWICLICLSELIYVRPRSLGVNSWYLCHYLTSSGVAIVSEFGSTQTCFGWADLIWAYWFSVVFTVSVLVASIRRSIWITKLILILLIIINSGLFESSL